MKVEFRKSNRFVKILKISNDFCVWECEPSSSMAKDEVRCLAEKKKKKRQKGRGSTARGLDQRWREADRLVRSPPGGAPRWPVLARRGADEDGANRVSRARQGRQEIRKDPKKHGGLAPREDLPNTRARETLAPSFDKFIDDAWRNSASQVRCNFRCRESHLFVAESCMNYCIVYWREGHIIYYELRRHIKDQHRVSFTIFLRYLYHEIFIFICSLFCIWLWPCKRIQKRGVDRYLLVSISSSILNPEFYEDRLN